MPQCEAITAHPRRAPNDGLTSFPSAIASPTVHICQYRSSPEAGLAPPHPETSSGDENVSKVPRGHVSKQYWPNVDVHVRGRKRGSDGCKRKRNVHHDVQHHGQFHAKNIVRRQSCLVLWKSPTAAVAQATILRQVDEHKPM